MQIIKKLIILGVNYPFTFYSVPHTKLQFDAGSEDLNSENILPYSRSHSLYGDLFL